MNNGKMVCAVLTIALAAASLPGEVEQVFAATKKKIALCMVTQSAERWLNDAANMKMILDDKGYMVDAYFAKNDPIEQVNQVEQCIDKEYDCLVIAPVDSAVLTKVEEKAKEEGIPIIAYDRLLMNTDAVSYYATFDNREIGRQIGQYIRDNKDLEAAQSTGETYNIEFFMGSPDDNNAVFMYNGIMDILQEYLDDGTLVCRSGKTSFVDTCILRWSRETAKENCEELLKKYYSEGETLDIVCSAYDGFAYGVREALMDAEYIPGSENWPMITGQDADVKAIRNIIEGSQTMTIYKDTRVLADKCAKMVDAVLRGTEPEINDTEQYNNGKCSVPTYMCTTVAVDKSNYQEALLDSEYYSKIELGISGQEITRVRGHGSHVGIG